MAILCSSSSVILSFSSLKHSGSDRRSPFLGFSKIYANTKRGVQVNAEKVAVSRKKRNHKLYRRHSGRPGGITVQTFDQLQHRIPERIIEHALRGMLPKGRVS